MCDVKVSCLLWLVACAICARFQPDLLGSENATGSSRNLGQLQRDGVFTDLRSSRRSGLQHASGHMQKGRHSRTRPNNTSNGSHRSGLQHASGHMQKGRHTPSLNDHSLLQVAEQLVNETGIDTSSVGWFSDYFVWFRYDAALTGNNGDADSLHIDTRRHQLQELKGMKELKGGGSGQFVGVYETAEQGAAVAKQMSLSGTEKDKDEKEVKNALLPAELFEGYDKLPNHPHISAERKKVGLPLFQLVCQVGPIAWYSPTLQKQLDNVRGLLSGRLTDGLKLAPTVPGFQRSVVLRDTVLKAAQELSLKFNVKMYMVAPFVTGGVVGNALAERPQDEHIQSAIVDTIVGVLIARISDCQPIEQPEELYGVTLGKKFTERTSEATRGVLFDVSFFFLSDQTRRLFKASKFKFLDYNGAHLNGDQRSLAYSNACIKIAEHLRSEGGFLSKFVRSQSQHFWPAWGSPPLHTDANMQNLVFSEDKQAIKFVDNAASADSIQALSLELFKLNFGYTHSGNLAKKFPCKVRMTSPSSGAGTGAGSSNEEPSIVLAPEALDTFNGLLKGERQFIDWLKKRILSSPQNKDIMDAIKLKLEKPKDDTGAEHFIKTLFAQGLLYALMQRVSDTGYAVEGQMRETLRELDERKIDLNKAAETLIGLVNRCLANMNMYFRQKRNVFKDLLDILELPDGSRLLEQTKFPDSPFAAMHRRSSSS